MALRERPQSRQHTKSDEPFIEAVGRVCGATGRPATSRQVFGVLYPGEDPISYTGEHKLTRLIRKLKALAERDLIDGAWVKDRQRYEWWPA